MWTTKIDSAVKTDTYLSITVHFFKDGVKVHAVDFDRVPEPSSIKSLIQNQLNQLIKIDEINPSTLLGDFELTPAIAIPVPTPVLPSQEELDQVAYMEDVRTMALLRKAISFGAIDESHPTFLEVQSNLKKNWKDSYLLPLTFV